MEPNVTVVTSMPWATMMKAMTRDECAEDYRGSALCFHPIDHFDLFGGS